MAEYRPIDPHADTGWDDFVRTSPDGWVWGLSGWQRLIERVEEWGLQPLSFEMRENGRRVAIMPLHLNRAGVAASSGWGWVGPMLAEGLPSEERRSILKRLMTHAEQIGQDAGASELIVGSPAIVRTNIENIRGVNPFFPLGYEERSGNALVIDLTVDETHLWSNLSANARQEIRKAERQGWRAVQVNWREHLDSYYNLHVETYRRTGVEPHPKSYFSGIAEEIASVNHAVLWAGLNPQGQPQAYHNDATLQGGCLYHTGCGTTDSLQYGINYLLMWHSIRAAKMRGDRHYEIGEVFFDVREGKQVGLTQFKSKFGGELYRTHRARKKLVAPSSDHTPPSTPPVPSPLSRLFSRFRNG